MDGRSLWGPQLCFCHCSDELHRVRRGALNPLFSRQRILDLQDVIQGKVDILVDRVREFQIEGKAMPITRAFSALTEEVIMEYCFSLSYDALRKPEFENRLHDPIMAADAFSNVSLQFRWIPMIIFNLPQSLVVKMQPDYAMFFRMQGVCGLYGRGSKTPINQRTFRSKSMRWRLGE